MGMILSMLQFPGSKLLEYIEHPENFKKDMHSNNVVYFKKAIDTDLTWEAIHYLVNGSRLDIVWGSYQLPESSKPLSLIIYGDQYFDKSQELGLGPASYITPEQVKQINSAIELLTIELVKAKYDPADMTAKQIYGTRGAWDEGDFDYIFYYFCEVKKFYKKAAKNDFAIATFFC